MKFSMGWRKATSLVLALVMVSFALVGAGCSMGGKKFPKKPITLLIPWTPGSASDLAVRSIAKYAEKELGQPITPVNKDGANGATCWAELAAAKPDGYTIGLVTFDIMTNQATGRSPTKYNGFDYLLQFTTQPMGIGVRSDSPYKTLDDLIKAAKAKPSAITAGTTAIGGVIYQVLGMLEKAVGVKFRAVPFQGSSEINAAALGKQVDVWVNTFGLPDQYVKDGTFRLLAVSSEKRIARFSEVPTFKELGYDIVHESFRTVAVPKGVPEDVKKVLADAFKKAFDNPEYQDAAVKAKQETLYRNHADFMKFADALYPKVLAILTDLGMTKK